MKGVEGKFCGAKRAEGGNVFCLGAKKIGNGQKDIRMKQIETENGYIEYEIKNGKALITGFRGTASRIRLPGQIEGCPVIAVDRRAFLSKKGLYALHFPDSIEEVGDWAFAHCDHLTELSFPRRDVRFGRTVFKNCQRLKRIELRDCPYAAPELLAAAVTLLDAYYLLDLREAGSRAWLEKWDTKLLSVLRASDQEDYISQSVYGEEDYIGMDLEEFTSAKRKVKVRLAFLRLLRPRGLSPSLREELERYLRSLTKGRANEEAWQVLKEEHGEDREYYSLFAEIGCIGTDNFSEILADMGEEAPEMKAFFLQSMEERRNPGEDFFQGLEL